MNNQYKCKVWKVICVCPFVLLAFIIQINKPFMSTFIEVHFMGFACVWHIMYYDLLAHGMLPFPPSI